MNFRLAEPNENFVFREVSENGLVEIGVHPVVFGFRVRGGFVGDQFVHIDWCCGNEQSQIEYIYSVLKSILSRRDEDIQCFYNLLPNSKIKPLYLDAEFMTWLVEHIRKGVSVQNLPNLYELKQAYMNNLLQRHKDDNLEINK